MEELEVTSFLVKGITKVSIPSKDHTDIPYYNLLLEDNNGSFHIKKSMKEQQIGDKIELTAENKEDKAIVAVIGTGTTGSGIAQVFASSGYQVILKSRSDESLAKCLAKIEKQLLP